MFCFREDFDKNKTSRWEFLINPKSVWPAARARGSLEGIRGMDFVNGEPLSCTLSRLPDTHTHTYTRVPAPDAVRVHKCERARPRGRRRKPDGSPRGQGREPFAGDHNQLAHASRIRPFLSAWYRTPRRRRVRRGEGNVGS